MIGFVFVPFDTKYSITNLLVENHFFVIYTVTELVSCIILLALRQTSYKPRNRRQKQKTETEDRNRRLAKSKWSCLLRTPEIISLGLFHPAQRP
jgi:hypothetical protein